MIEKRTGATPEEKYEALKAKPRDFVDRVGRCVDHVAAHGDAGYAGTLAGARRLCSRYAEEIVVARGQFREKMRDEAVKREQTARKEAADAAAVDQELDGEARMMEARASAIARLENLASPSIKMISSLLTDDTRLAVEKLSDDTARTISKIRFEHGEVSLIEFKADLGDRPEIGRAHV